MVAQQAGKVNPVYAHLFATPLGPLTCAVNDSGELTRLLFTDSFEFGQMVIWDAARNAEIVRQVGEYFDGSRHAFDLPLAPSGTAWQKRVWQELLRLPFGATTTYGMLAAKLGNPAASRAVGHANAANPICLVIPCHRVVGANGALTGYAFGTSRKEKLLALECSAGR